ncbi:MAG TPA: STAS domain-containing protein [Opitutaceae bacterium]|nr:STAS domain-containing protein [Opitutaceae bacterium]
MQPLYNPELKTLRVTIPGDVLSTNAETLRRDITAALNNSAPNTLNVLELDLRAARMVDSAGLNLIVSLVRAASQRSCRIRALVENTNVQRTFLFTRLDRYLELVTPTQE